MNKELLKPGDIGLYHGTTFLAKSIQYFMKKYKRMLGLPNNTKLYNH